MILLLSTHLLYTSRAFPSLWDTYQDKLEERQVCGSRCIQLQTTSSSNKYLSRSQAVAEFQSHLLFGYIARTHCMNITVYQIALGKV